MLAASPPRPADRRGSSPRACGSRRDGSPPSPPKGGEGRGSDDLFFAQGGQLVLREAQQAAIDVVAVGAQQR